MVRRALCVRRLPRARHRGLAHPATIRSSSPGALSDGGQRQPFSSKHLRLHGTGKAKSDSTVPLVHGAPIRLTGKTIGFWHLNCAAPNFFTVVHAERLQAFADRPRFALQNAQLHEKRMRWRWLDERQRLDGTCRRGQPNAVLCRMIAEACRACGIGREASPRAASRAIPADTRRPGRDADTAAGAASFDVTGSEPRRIAQQLPSGYRCERA